MDIDNPSYFAVPDGHPDTTDSDAGPSRGRQLTPPRTRSFAREKRSFLRSVSSNSADSNQEMFFMGEPRLCDIAPDLVAKSCSSGSRSDSLKNRKERVVDDVTYMPLATSEEQADCQSGDEVFIAEDSARYYNFPSVKHNGQRRHSIGTFVARDRTHSVASSTKSFKEDFPQRENEYAKEGVDIDEHSLRHASYPRKRCTRCARGKCHYAITENFILNIEH